MKLSVRALASVMAVLLAAAVLLWLAWPAEEHVAAALPSRSATADATMVEPSWQAEEATDSVREAVPIETISGVERSRQGMEMPVGYLRVLVRAEEDGTPQAGTQIVVSPKERRPRGKGEPRTSGRSKLTDAEGRAELAVVPGEALLVQVSGRAQMVLRELEALEAGESVDLVVELRTREDIHLFGRIQDDESGAPLVGRVRASGVGLANRFIETDSSGGFELTAGSWERASGTAEADGYAPTEFAISSGYEDPLRPLIVRLSRAAVLEAFVRDRTGALVPGAWVELSTITRPLPRSARMLSLPTDASSHWTAKTDPSGRAILDDLLPLVPLRLSVTGDGWPSRAEPEPIVLAPGEHRRVDLVLGRGATITGVLEDASGSPIPRYQVWCDAALANRPPVFEIGESPAWKTRTDSDGRFRFESIPAGTWWVGPAPHSRSNKLADDYLPVAQVVEVVNDWAEIEILVRVDREH